MRTQKRPVGKLIMLFAAVAVFQCCCCIIPYTLNTRLDSFSLTTFLEQPGTILFPPRESLKASNPPTDLITEGITELDDASVSAKGIRTSLEYDGIVNQEELWEKSVAPRASNSWIIQ